MKLAALVIARILVLIAYCALVYASPMWLGLILALLSPLFVGLLYDRYPRSKGQPR